MNVVITVPQDKTHTATIANAAALSDAIEAIGSKSGKLLLGPWTAADISFFASIDQGANFYRVRKADSTLDRITSIPAAKTVSGVPSEKAITGATNATPIVITSVAHGFTNGQHVKIVSVGGNTAANGNDWVVANKTADTFELAGSVGNGAYTSGGKAWINNNGVTQLTVTAHGFVNGETVTFASIGGATELNVTADVTVIDANTVSIPIQNTTAYTSGGTATKTQAYSIPSSVFPCSHFKIHSTNTSTEADVAQGAARSIPIYLDS